jgi:hypothetical protein
MRNILSPILAGKTLAAWRQSRDREAPPIRRLALRGGEYARGEKHI